MIKGTQVSWKTQKKQILNQVSFEIKQGRIITFMGQSGAGKTTLLRCIANLNAEYEGHITCNEVDLKSLNPAQRSSTIGFVHQQFNLFPHLNVMKNCSYALEKVLELPKQAAEQRVLETLAMLNMEAFAQARPSHLSGGQQQRVAIARALVMHPEVLLLDEPTSALDPDSKKSLETLLLDLNAKGITIALSSHDMPFIQKIKDVIYFMANGEIVEEYDSRLHTLESKSKISSFLSHV